MHMEVETSDIRRQTSDVRRLVGFGCPLRRFPGTVDRAYFAFGVLVGDKV